MFFTSESNPLSDEINFPLLSFKPLLIDKIAQTQQTLTSGAKEGSAGYIEVEKLTQQILKKELQILVLSTLVWRENLRDTHLWNLRRLMYRTLSQGLAVAGYTIDVAVYFGYRQNTPKYSTLSGSLLRFIGKNQVIAGLTFERSLAVVKQHKTARRSLDLKTSDKIVEGLVHEVEALLKKRSQLLATISGISAQERDILDRESELLDDIHSRAIDEYTNLHYRVVGKNYALASSDYLRIMRRTDGAYLGNLPSIIRTVLNAHLNKMSGSSSLRLPSVARATIKSSTPADPSYIGLSRASSLGTLTSGSMGVVIPFIVYASTKAVMDRSRAHMEKRLGKPVRSFDDLAMDVHRYGTRIENDDISNSLPAYIAQKNYTVFKTTSSILAGMDKLTRDEMHHVKMRSIHVDSLRVFSASTKVARGILKVIRDWDPYYYPASKRSLISGYAALVRLPGTGIFLADSLLTWGYEITNHKQLAEKRILPSKILASRIEVIDSMQKEIDGNLNQIGSNGASQAWPQK